MNILSVNKFYWRKGGSETVFFGEKELLESKGHKVVPFSMKSEQNLDNEYSRFFVDEIDYDKGGALSKVNSALTVLYSTQARKKMKSLLREFTPDIAHFHIFQHQISPSVFGPLRQQQIPLVLSLHDLKPLCPNYKMYTNGQVCEECKGRKFYKSFTNTCNKGSKVKSLVSTIEMYLHYMLGYYQNVDRYIAVSKFYQQKMLEFGFPEHQVSYLPNYIDTSEIQYGTKDDNYVLSFGRLSEEKGIDILIRAAELCPNIPIIIAGSGPEEQALHELVDEKNIKNVSFVGFQTGNSLEKLISHSSFTVITSQWYENCPMSVLESLAYGKPVIGANIGGIPELIDTDNDGFIYEPDNHENLAEKINTLWKMKKERKEMGRVGRQKIEEKFNPELHYKQLVTIYNELLT